MDPNGIRRYETNASVNIPMEVFEKMYLTPQLPVKGELRKTFGNPTPMQVLQFHYVYIESAHSCSALFWASFLPRLLSAAALWAGGVLGVEAPL